jgi:methyl-accepting chemotaxis protein
MYRFVGRELKPLERHTNESSSGEIGCDELGKERKLSRFYKSLTTVRSRYSLYRLGFDHQEFLELALTDHLLLNWRLRAMLQGLTKLDEAKIGEHRMCRLGKWYYGEGQPIFGHHPAFIELEQHHEKIHHTAKEMIIAYKNGNRQKAESLYQVIDQEIGPMMVQVIKDIK